MCDVTKRTNSGYLHNIVRKFADVAPDSTLRLTLKNPAPVPPSSAPKRRRTPGGRDEVENVAFEDSQNTWKEKTKFQVTSPYLAQRFATQITLERGGRQGRDPGDSDNFEGPWKKENPGSDRGGRFREEGEI